MTEISDEVQAKAKILGETATAPWRELQKFFASGQTIYVSESLDLIEVAYQFSLDNKDSFERWIEQGEVAAVSDEQALDWHSNDVHLWTVVVRPWVLVQRLAEGSAQP